MTKVAAEQTNNTRYGLSEATINKINQVFSRCAEVKRVIIYGSRAKGNYHPGSDIDLTLFGANLDQRQCAEIADQLDELLLPYMIDLSVFHLLDHKDLREHIERVGKVFYPCEQ